MRGPAWRREWGAVTFVVTVLIGVVVVPLGLYFGHQPAPPPPPVSITSASPSPPATPSPATSPSASPHATPSPHPTSSP